MMRTFILRSQLSTGASSAGRATMIGIGLLALTPVLVLVSYFVFTENESGVDAPRWVYKAGGGLLIGALIAFIMGIRFLLNARAMKRLTVPDQP